MSKFYTFGQNNSGGSFDFDKKSGITHWVIIEADSVEHANDRATDAGIYFDGGYDGRDCSCCGDRWYPTRYSKGTNTPTIYEMPIKEYFKDNPHLWMEKGFEICIHYKDGCLEWH